MNVLDRYGLKKEDLFYYGQWEQPPLSAQFWVHWFDQHIVDEMGFGLERGTIVMLNGHTIPSRYEIETAKRMIKNACTAQDSAFFTRVGLVSEHILHEHLRFAEELEQDNDAQALFTRFVASSRRVMVPWTISVYISDMLGDVLAERAEALGVDAAKIFDHVPKKQTLMLKQYHEALAIKEMLREKGLLGQLNRTFDAALFKIKQDEALWGHIQRHVRKYAWVGTHHFWGEPLTVEKFMKEIESVKEKIRAHEIKKEEPLHELAFLTHVGGEMMFLRQYAAEVFDVVAFRARPLLGGIAKELDLSYEELLWFTSSEIDSYLTSGKKPARSVVQQRKSGVCILKKDNKEIVIDNRDEVSELIEAFVEAKSVLTSELHGAVASKGRARGTAKIFLVPENMAKMKEGDILVTTMTTPDFVPLMQKAAATVTDIGGLLSHAAIVSREMGKPCIVGTQIATKVFRDGDIVEVDANQGVVRKIR